MDTQKQKSKWDRRHEVWEMAVVYVGAYWPCWLCLADWWSGWIFSHYHKPLETFQHTQLTANGTRMTVSAAILRDAVLTGTSMMENFKASRFDSLFGVSSVKIPYAGGYYKEVDQAV